MGHTSSSGELAVAASAIRTDGAPAPAGDYLSGRLAEERAAHGK
jgi:hypothetical protein